MGHYGIVKDGVSHGVMQEKPSASLPCRLDLRARPVVIYEYSVFDSGAGAGAVAPDQ